MAENNPKKKKANKIIEFLRKATGGSMVGDIGSAAKTRDDRLKEIMDDPSMKRKKAN